MKPYPDGVEDMVPASLDLGGGKGRLEGRRRIPFLGP
jgi:hypothetical protein